MIEGSTLQPGSHPATIGGAIVTINNKGDIVISNSAASTAALSTLKMSNTTALSASGAIFYIGPAGVPMTASTTTDGAGQQVAVISGQTLSTNGQGATLDGTTLSMTSGNLIVAASGVTSTAVMSALPAPSAASTQDQLALSVAPGMTIFASPANVT